MKGHLPPQARRERLERLLAAAERSSAAYREAQIGRFAEVLWERETDGLWQGLTPNYVRAYDIADSDLENRVTRAEITGLRGDGVSVRIAA